MNKKRFFLLFVFLLLLLHTCGCSPKPPNEQKIKEDLSAVFAEQGLVLNDVEYYDKGGRILDYCGDRNTEEWTVVPKERPDVLIDDMLLSDDFLAHDLFYKQ